MFSLITSIILAASEPSVYQMANLVCHDRVVLKFNEYVVAKYLIDVRTTRWIIDNKKWVLMQYGKNNLAQYRPKNYEQCYSVNSDN
jgi:hypothetical protein